MPETLEPLLASTFWSIRRPKFPLTPGHFLIWLNDPAAVFGIGAAADLLRCYGHLRQALDELAGAVSAQLYTALKWEPTGDAVGEPLPETSSPTVHAFFTWPDGAPGSGGPDGAPGSGGQRKPMLAAALHLPAHQRVPARRTGALDEQLRKWNGGRLSASLQRDSVPESGHPHPGDPAPGADRTWEPEGWANRPFHIEPVHPGPGLPFRGGHWTALPRFGTAPLDTIDPSALVGLATTIKGLATHSLPPFSGLSVWALDSPASPEPVTIHIFARRHGEKNPLLAAFVAGGTLDPVQAPEPQGQSGSPSHNLMR